jgi:hypothetical protein
VVGHAVNARPRPKPHSNAVGGTASHQRAPRHRRVSARRSIDGRYDLSSAALASPCCPRGGLAQTCVSRSTRRRPRERAMRALHSPTVPPIAIVPSMLGSPAPTRKHVWSGWVSAPPLTLRGDVRGGAAHEHAFRRTGEGGRRSCGRGRDVCSGGSGGVSGGSPHEGGAGEVAVHALHCPHCHTRAQEREG